MGGREAEAQNERVLAGKPAASVLGQLLAARLAAYMRLQRTDPSSSRRNEVGCSRTRASILRRIALNSRIHQSRSRL